MNKEKVINILKSFEYFMDDDWGGSYHYINCSQRATTPLGILQILDYIDDLEQENTNLKQALNEIREYVLNNSVIPRYKKSLAIDDGSMFKGDISDILQIIDKVIGDEKE